MAAKTLGEKVLRLHLNQHTIGHFHEPARRHRIFLKAIIFAFAVFGFIEFIITLCRLT